MWFKAVVTRRHYGMKVNDVVYVRKTTSKRWKNVVDVIHAGGKYIGTYATIEVQSWAECLKEYAPNQGALNQKFKDTHGR